ncbi:hypothetical protein PK35_03660 [Tamlana nanhaiensis]|uniref:Carboxypeptidase-like regulatory domain-containing protein n=1 Tax=Neotamlana nanhaiensis TaxID=1382798 RepID=A0A0D7W578_9FLAO|nr:carboxypeptidase-like regulatory domain-containing protein [Tamlana nanhaiensis]KJD33853.1 hypothetical protein PK35_03660 [Tamlana nanhaiensis]
MLKHILYCFVLNISVCCFSQTLTGLVLDATTKQPIETASVYFDNTTLGTTTNVNGEFSITYNNSIQSNLIISFIGYYTKVISNYRSLSKTTIALQPSTNTLDEVVINADDGLTRKQKLNIFRAQFLGSSKYAKRCKILNEDDLILRYNKAKKQLTAYNKAPLQIINKALQYHITYNIEAFTVNFNYVDAKNSQFNVHSTVYVGSTFFSDLENLNIRKAKKARNAVYQGSTLEFMRALYNKQLIEKNYQIYFKRFPVPPYKYIKVEPVKHTTFKRVTLTEPVQILYKKSQQSGLTILSESIIVDVYGNYVNPTDVLFSGFMGYQRIGDVLPLDYGLTE